MNARFFSEVFCLVDVSLLLGCVLVETRGA